MEANNQRRVVGLKEKIPDIQKTLDTVRFLKQRKVCTFGGVFKDVLALTRDSLQSDAEPFEAMFELNDTLFAKANIHETDEVYLWLGVCETP
jgi:prefoldin subunit 5